MGAALRRIDVVYKCIDILCIGIIVLHGYFHIHAFLGSLAVNNLLVKRCLALIQVCDEFLDTALIVECLFLLFFPVVLKGNPQVLGQERSFPEPDFQRVVIIDRFLEYLLVRQECNLGSMLFRSAFSHNF